MWGDSESVRKKRRLILFFINSDLMIEDLHLEKLRRSIYYEWLGLGLCCLGSHGFVVNGEKRREEPRSPVRPLKHPDPGSSKN